MKDMAEEAGDITPAFDIGAEGFDVAVIARAAQQMAANCPPGMKTGDAISPPGGYVGGCLQMQVDVGIGPAGDVWVTNNWQYWPAALERSMKRCRRSAAARAWWSSMEWRSPLARRSSELGCL